MPSAAFKYSCTAFKHSQAPSLPDASRQRAPNTNKTTLEGAFPFGNSRFACHQAFHSPLHKSTYLPHCSSRRSFPSCFLADLLTSSTQRLKYYFNFSRQSVYLPKDKPYLVRLTIFTFRSPKIEVKQAPCFPPAYSLISSFSSVGCLDTISPPATPHLSNCPLVPASSHQAPAISSSSSITSFFLPRIRVGVSSASSLMRMD